MPTVKVVEEVRQRHPELYMVTFKSLEGVSHDELIRIARARLDRFPCVVANRGEEQTPGVWGAEPPSSTAQRRAWIVTRDGDPRPVDGKRALAEALADHLESALGGSVAGSG